MLLAPIFLHIYIMHVPTPEAAANISAVSFFFIFATLTNN
jgi:hypothetical protein